MQPKYEISAIARYEFPGGSVNAFVQGSMNAQSNWISLLGVNDDEVFGYSFGFITAHLSVGGKKGQLHLPVVHPECLRQTRIAVTQCADFVGGLSIGVQVDLTRSHALRAAYDRRGPTEARAKAIGWQSTGDGT